MKYLIIFLFALLPFFAQAQLLRAYGVVEIGSTFPTSSTTGAKFAYRTTDSSFYRWIHTNVWVKVVEPTFDPDTLYLKQLSGTTALVDGDTIDISTYLLHSDTSSMLAAYIRLAGWGLLKTTKTLTVDSSKVASRYYVSTSPTTIAANYIATSNGTNLVARNLFDNNVYVGVVNSKPFSLAKVATAGLPTGAKAYMVYDTTFNGIRWYNGTRWSTAWESTLARFTTGSLIFADANGQATQNNAKLFWNDGLGYLGINRNTGLSFNLDVNGTGRIGSLVFETNGFAGATGQGISQNNTSRTMAFTSQGAINIANASAFSFAPYGSYSLTQSATGRTMAFMDLNGTIGTPNTGPTTFGMLRIRPTYNFPVQLAAPPWIEANGILYDPTLTSMYVTGHNFIKATSGNILFGISGSGVFGYGTTNPSRSSVIDFVSTSKGALLPRMNTSQRNAVPTSVLSATLTNPGSGYSPLLSCTITGGGGSGAVAFANTSGGAITSISILNPGEGYSSTPTLTITGGGGTGGAATINLAPLPESLLLYNIDSTTFEFLDNTLAYRQIATRQYVRSNWLKPRLEAGDVTISKTSTPSYLNLKNAGIRLKDINAKTTHTLLAGAGFGFYAAHKTGGAGNLGGAYSFIDTLGKDFEFYMVQDDASVQQNAGTGPQIVNYLVHPSLPVTGSAWSYGVRIDTTVSIPTVRHMYGNRNADVTIPGTHKFLAGLRGNETLSGFDFRSFGTDGKIAFNVNSALNIRQGGKVYFGSDSTFSFDPSTDILQLSEYDNSASFTPNAVGEEATELFLTTSATTGKVLQRGMRQTTNVKDADLAVTDDMLELSFDIHVWAYCSNAASDSVVIDLPTPALDYVSQKVSVYGDGRNATPGRDVYVRCVGAKLWHGNASPTGETYYQVTSLGGINSKTAEFICVQNPDDSLYYWQLIQHQ